MNHYTTVGVNPDAGSDEIKKAFKKRAGKVHPDRSGGDTEEFKKLNHAYSVISDPERRALYDKTGSDEKPKDHLSEANANLGQIFLRIISSEQKGDIVKMVTSEIENSIIQAKQNREKVDKLVVNFELKLHRVVSKSENNMYDSIINEQIIKLNLQLKQFDDFIKVGDLMIMLLDDYSDSKPDVVVKPHNLWHDYSTTSVLSGGNL